MNIAVLSDIHSNKYALSETLKFLENKDIDKYIFLGDYFGYYPWAKETFTLLRSYFNKSHHILGNHDNFFGILQMVKKAALFNHSQTFSNYGNPEILLFSIESPTINLRAEISKKELSSDIRLQNLVKLFEVYATEDNQSEGH